MFIFADLTKLYAVTYAAQYLTAVAKYPAAVGRRALFRIANIQHAEVGCKECGVD